MQKLAWSKLQRGIGVIQKQICEAQLMEWRSYSTGLQYVLDINFNT